MNRTRPPLPKLWFPLRPHSGTGTGPLTLCLMLWPGYSSAPWAFLQRGFPQSSWALPHTARAFLAPLLEWGIKRAREFSWDRTASLLERAIAS
jgi:hypothetical protein